MNKKQLPLIIGLSMPVLLVLALAAFIYLPRLYVEPTHDFVYATGYYPSYVDVSSNERVDFEILDGSLTKTVVSLADDKNYSWRDTAPRFYLHDVDMNTSRLLSYEEASKLYLNDSDVSPDGFEIDYASSTDNFFEAFFGGRDSRKRVLEKGSVSRQLNLAGESSSQFHFVGWVLK